MSDAFAMFAPYRDRPKVTIFGSARTLDVRSAVRPGSRGGGRTRRCRMDGHHRRRSGHHAGGHGGRRPRGLDRRVDQAAVRAGRQPDHRRRLEVRQHEVLLHAQADADQGEPWLRLPAGRVRHAGRDLRAADADADRQGRAGSDRAARHPGRSVLGDGARVRRPATGRAGPGLAGRHRPVPGDRGLSPGARSRSRASTQLRLDAIRRRPVGRFACATSPPTSRSRC